MFGITKFIVVIVKNIRILVKHRLKTKLKDGFVL